jgi:DNA repair protein RadC
MTTGLVKNIPAKRVDVVSVKLVKESSVMYEPRYINTPQDAAHLVEEFLAYSDREKVVAICLDVKNQPTAISTISMGTLHSSLVHPREVFKTAILSNAAGFILAHNHPSGDLTPSKDDLNVTKRLKEAGDLMGIDLLDHIIVGNGERYTSFREQGLM